MIFNQSNLFIAVFNLKLKQLCAVV